MAILPGQFDEAFGNVEPSKHDKDNAPRAHEEVRAVLLDDPRLASYGADPVLIGSYKRHVSIRRIKDVDVFCKLPGCPAGVDPQRLLGHVFMVLDKAFGNDDRGEPRATRQDRSVQVDFPEYDLYVDAVVARPCRAHWEIPQRAGGWEQTNPERLTTLTTAMNKAHGELYVPTVKLVRQIRRAALGKQKPGGLYFEIAAYNAFAAGSVAGSSSAEYYTSALAGVADQLDRAIGQGLGLDDPSMPGEKIRVRATPEQLATARRKFRQAARKAAEALAETNRCRAAKLFQELLGRNGDGDLVFPLPDDCNPDGTAKALAYLRPGDRRVPAGDRRFG
jgi:hypothetical protein